MSDTDRSFDFASVRPNRDIQQGINRLAVVSTQPLIEGTVEIPLDEIVSMWLVSRGQIDFGVSSEIIMASIAAKNGKLALVLTIKH